MQHLRFVMAQSMVANSISIQTTLAKKRPIPGRESGHWFLKSGWHKWSQYSGKPAKCIMESALII